MKNSKKILLLFVLSLGIGLGWAQYSQMKLATRSIASFEGTDDRSMALPPIPRPDRSGNQLAEKQTADQASNDLRADDLPVLADLKEGQTVSLPVLQDEVLHGKVNLIQHDQDGWLRIGGELLGSRFGSFSLHTNGTEYSGRVLLPAEKLAIQIRVVDGKVVVTQKHLDEVISSPVPLPPAPASE